MQSGEKEPLLDSLYLRAQPPDFLAFDLLGRNFIGERRSRWTGTGALAPDDEDTELLNRLLRSNRPDSHLKENYEEQIVRMRQVCLQNSLQWTNILGIYD